ncbi:MAG: hypothetical protein A07HR60_02570 [uncultured archaeon A07HR60]|nr:MAG: hypothetical protein A07HR60_02570 [uncultured archaeon A07HR60]
MTCHSDVSGSDKAVRDDKHDTDEVQVQVQIQIIDSGWESGPMMGSEDSGIFVALDAKACVNYPTLHTHRFRGSFLEERGLAPICG